MTLSEKLFLSYVNFIKRLRNISINIFTSLFFKPANTVNKILINRDGAFGDSIVSLPAINIIRQNYPLAQIDLLSVNNEGISFKDIGLDKHLINNLYNIKKQQRKDTLKKLKTENYDLFVQIPQNIGLYKTIRNILLVRFYLKIKYAFGWDCGRIKSFMRLQKQHGAILTETERFINTLKKNGLHGKINYPLDIQQPSDININNLLQSKSIVVFLIGGKLQPKKWPLTHWVTLAKLIGDDQTILIIGGNDEIDDGEHIKSRTNNTNNLCGKLTIPELRYVLHKSNMVVSLDTGAMHLCNSTQTNLVALFSTRDLSNKWFPNYNNAIVIEKVLPCSFCLKTSCTENICMSNILPDEVYSKLQQLLETNS